MQTGHKLSLQGFAVVNCGVLIWVDVTDVSNVLCDISINLYVNVENVNKTFHFKLI